MRTHSARRKPRRHSKKHDKFGEMVKPRRPKGSDKKKYGNDDEPVGAELLDPKVCAILDNIKNSRERRRRTALFSEMENIHSRVKQALEHFGLPGNIHCTAEEEAAIKADIRRPPGFNSKEKRKRMEKKKDILVMIGDYFNNNQERNMILAELGDLIDSWAVELTENPELKEDAEFLAEDKQIFQIYNEVTAAFTFAERAGAKLSVIGQKLLRGVENNSSDDEEDGENKSESPRKPPSTIVVHDEDALLSDPSIWRAAGEDIILMLEDLVRQLRTNQARSNVRASVKQIKFLCNAMEREQDELEKRRETIVCLESELETVKKKKVSLSDKCEKLEKKVTRLDTKLAKAQASGGDLDDNDGMRGPKGRRASMARGRKPDNSAALRLLDQMSEEQAQMANANTALKDELTQAKVKIKQHEHFISTLEAQVKTEQEKCSRLKEQLDSSQDMADNNNIMMSDTQDDMKSQVKSLIHKTKTYERQLMSLKIEMKSKNDVIQSQEERIRDLINEVKRMENEAVINAKNRKESLYDTSGKLPNEYQKVIDRLKKECQAELRRIKAHLDKERQRSEATMRKLEHNHGEQLVNIHRESIRLLRAINHFKDSIAQILDRENLSIAANDVYSMASLPTDEAHNDAKALLCQMAGHAVELLVALELKLSQALMNKRLEIKDNTLAKSFATKDMEHQMEAAHKAKQTAGILMVRLRQMKEKLETTEDRLKSLKKDADKRYQTLADRYKMLGSQNTKLRKELDALTKEHTETMKSKDMALMMSEQSRAEMSRTVEQQNLAIMEIHQELKQKQMQSEKTLYLTMSDHRGNLEVLKEAYAECRLSQEMYTMCQDMIKESMDIPLLRLRHMIDRYIAFRRMKDARALLELQTNRSLPPQKKEELLAYLERMDGKLEKSASNWQRRSDLLLEKRRFLFDSMNYALSELIRDNGLFLVLPKPNGNLLTQALTPKRSRTRRGSLPLVDKGSLPKLDNYAGLVGTNVIHGEGTEQTWKIPDALPPIATLVDVPHFLELDVNKQYRDAKKTLVTGRPPYPVSVAEGFDFQTKKVRPLRATSSADLEGKISRSETCVN